MAIKQRRFASFRGAIAAVLLLAAAASADTPTLLTNGSEVFFRRAGVEERNPLNGSEGFSILVPPGATSLRVVFQTDPNLPLELLARNGLDVGLLPEDPTRETFSPDRADFFAVPNNLGVAEIRVDAQSQPNLEPGLYFIGFMTREEGLTEFSGTMTAFVAGGPIDPLYAVVESDFDEDADGWSRNADAGDPQSEFAYFAAGGSPDGFVAISDNGYGPDDFFVAPSKFFVNLIQLTDGRLEFDLARISGGRDPHFPVEVRVYSGETGWKHLGNPPTSVPSKFNFFTGQVDPIWRTVSAPFRKDLWARFAGEANFEESLSNPTRIEIRATYVITGGLNGIDNVRIAERGVAPPRPVIPTVTSFAGGFDRWDRNSRPATLERAAIGNAESSLQWAADDGNPGGRLVLADATNEGGPEPDAFLAPREYLGIYSGLNRARFEFDYLHRSAAGASEPVRLRLFGGNGALFEWTGVAPRSFWGRQTAPLDADVWMRIAGAETFGQLLENVVRIELSANLALGPESNSVDNFALLTAETPPLQQELTVAPLELRFAAVATGAPPAPQELQIAAAFPWSAAVSGAIADRIRLSPASGSASASVQVKVDTEGLPPGTHRFEITFTAPGATIAPIIASGSAVIAEQPFPTPEIRAIVQAADYQPRLAPGALGTIFGRNFHAPPGGRQARFGGPLGDQLPTELNGVRVLVFDPQGEKLGDAPLTYLGPEQINFQMPFEANGRTEVAIAVANWSVRGEAATVPITAAAPGVFTFGQRRAVVANADGSLNTAENPALRTKPLVVYLTGQGRVAPAWKTGRAAGSSPLIFAPQEARVFVGGVAAKITFFGLAPGMVGVAQLNFEPTYATPTGDQPLTVEVGGIESNRSIVTIE